MFPDANWVRTTGILADVPVFCSAKEDDQLTPPSVDLMIMYLYEVGPEVRYLNAA